MQESKREKKPVRVLIVDPQPIVRAGLRAVLAETDFEVVAESRSEGEIVALIEQHEPDVVIMDVELADDAMVQLLENSHRAAPDAQLIVYTKDASAAYVKRFLDCGARGVITKDAAPGVLVLALQIVLMGELFLSRRAVQSLLTFSGRTDQPPEEIDLRYASLSPREREILSHIVRGATSREIAGRFCISHRTVDNHRSRIMRKLGLRGSVELVRYGMQLGLVSLDDNV